MIGRGFYLWGPKHARNKILAAKGLSSKTVYLHVYFLLPEGRLNLRQFGFSPHYEGVALPGVASLLFSLPLPTSSDTMLTGEGDLGEKRERIEYTSSGGNNNNQSHSHTNMIKPYTYYD